MSNVLINLSNELAATVESVGPGLVRVEGRRRMPATGLIWSSEGVIVTAHHVIQQDGGLKVGLPSGETVSAELVGRDPSTDLAVLRAQTGGLTPAPRAAITADSLNVGHLVLALGRPGRTVQATLGIVSALSGEWRTPAGGNMDYYVQTDVVMYPGFSGGALVNAAGEIVGLNTSALLRGVSLAVRSTPSSGWPPPCWPTATSNGAIWASAPSRCACPPNSPNRWGRKPACC
jgi:S1-C subfamily serine protease